MSRLRVLFALGSLGVGGSERQTIELLRNLDRDRFEPSLYLLERRGAFLDQIPEDVATCAFSDDVASPRFNWPGRILFAQRRHFRNFVRRHRPDVLYERMVVTTLAVASGARSAGVPRVVTLDADPYFDLNDQAKRFRWFKKQALQVAYRNAAQLVAGSNDVADRGADLYGLAPSRFRVIHNAVDYARIDRLASESANPFPRDGSFRIVSVARLDRVKGHRYLVEAVASLVRDRGYARLRLHLLGTGPEEAPLRALVTELGVDGAVSFEGLTANPFPYLRHADLYCLSSESEGLPVALLEAMASRVPILSTDCPTSPRVVLGDGRFGRLVPPQNSGALADAIADAIENPSAWREKIEPARRRLEADFSIGGTVRKYEEVFIAAAESRSGARVPETPRDG